jgi:glucan phosphoethanolaminetransferase (alkaline phosphatase superfamily)
MNKDNITKNFIIGTFVTLYVLVSLISTIHVIDFFRLSNPNWLATTLAIAFEVGAAASLASIIALKKMNKGIVWVLFAMLTLMQAMGNTYYAYTHLVNYQSWIELFGLVDSEVIEQKRILSLVSGAILPLVALGFIKSLVDYIKPETEVIQAPVSIPNDIFTSVMGATPIDINQPKEEKVGSSLNVSPASANSKPTENFKMEVEDADQWVDDDADADEPENLEPIVEDNKEDNPKMNILNNIKVFVNGEAK